MTTFATNLRGVRERKGLTATRVAKAIGLSANTITQYERGEREPNILTIKKLADLFDVSVDELFEGVTDTPITIKQTLKTPWEMSGFSVVNVDDKFVRIEPSAELIEAQECVAIELPKATFGKLTRTMLDEAHARYPDDRALAERQFSFWSMIMTGKKAALRRLDPFKMIGAFVPVDYLPRAFRPSATA